MNGKRNGDRAGIPGGLAARLIARLGRPIIRRLSELARESLKEPGNWRCLEIVYRSKPRTCLDWFFLSSRSAKGARNRLRIMQEEICKCIEQRIHISNPVRVISFGSGPGHEILGCIERFQGNLAMEATCVDICDLTKLVTIHRKPQCER